MADILPQLIEFATQLDLQRLLVAQTTITLLAAIRTVPVYNIPLLFFGLYAYQHHDSIEPLQQFAGFTAFSVLLDIVWVILSSSFGFGEGLTIVALLFKPLTVISSLQLLKFRGDPFSSVGSGLNWSLASRSGAYDGGAGGYQSLADAMDDERDAQEVNIPRHGRYRNSQHSHQSSSYLTSSSRSGSVKSSRTSSGHHVDMSNHQNGHAGTPAPGNELTTKDDRRNKVGQANASEGEEDGDSSSHEAPASDSARSGYQPF